MKRVKIILSAIILLAGVGGALAFKAKYYNQAYCVRLGVLGSGDATECLITSFRSPVGGGVPWYYTITSNCNNCTTTTPARVQCANLGVVRGE